MFLPTFQTQLRNLYCQTSIWPLVTLTSTIHQKELKRHVNKDHKVIVLMAILAVKNQQGCTVWYSQVHSDNAPKAVASSPAAALYSQTDLAGMWKPMYLQLSSST